jgi:hypothetical protein
MVGKSKRGVLALRLYCTIDPKSRRFLAAGFKAQGCMAILACSSQIAYMIEGKTLKDALAITPDELIDAVGGLPAGKRHTATMAIEAVRAAVGDFMIREGASAAELDEELPCNGTDLSCLVCEHCSLRDSRILLSIPGKHRP